MTGKYQNLSLNDLKRLAKLRKRKKGIPLHEAQNEVAREAHFRDWFHAEKELAALSEAREKSPVVFQMDTATFGREIDRLDSAASQESLALFAAILAQVPEEFPERDRLLAAFGNAIARLPPQDDPTAAMLRLVRPAETPGMAMAALFPAYEHDERPWVGRMFSIASGKMGCLEGLKAAATERGLQEPSQRFKAVVAEIARRGNLGRHPDIDLDPEDSAAARNAIGPLTKSIYEDERFRDGLQEAEAFVSSLAEGSESSPELLDEVRQAMAPIPPEVRLSMAAARLLAVFGKPGEAKRVHTDAPAILLSLLDGGDVSEVFLNSIGISVVHLADGERTFTVQNAPGAPRGEKADKGP